MGKKNRVQTCNDLVLEETALKLGLHPVKDLGLIKEVVDAQLKFTIEKVAEGAFEGTMWPLLGKFRVKTDYVQGKRKRLDYIQVQRLTEKPIS